MIVESTKASGLKWLFCITVLLTYCLLFYFQFNLASRIDFPAFYSAGKAYSLHQNAYVDFSEPKSQSRDIIPSAANLNPPFFLEIIQSLSSLSYLPALIFWSVFNCLFNFVGILIVFRLVFSREFFTKHRVLLFATYFALFPVLMNIAIGQVGGLLLLLIILGYAAFVHKRDYWAGVCWGVITAIKLFPALLFFFALSHKRYKLLIAMSITFLIAAVIPLLTHGISAYQDFFTMQPRVLWYGNSWNASLLGMIFRFFYNPIVPLEHLLFIRIFYSSVFLITLLLYVYQLYRIKKKEEPGAELGFCFTLVMMLVLSPFGWLYYFTILIMPIIVSWQYLKKSSKSLDKRSCIWLSALLLLNFPLSYLTLKGIAVRLVNEPVALFFYKITIYSIHFYGLVVLLALMYSLLKTTETKPLTMPADINLSHPIFHIVLFGLIVPLIAFVLHLVDTP